MKYISSNIRRNLFDLIIMTIGCFIFAIGFNLFVLPHSLFTGGVTGISLLLYELTHISPAYTQWALNIPLFFVGWVIIGNEYALKIIFGSFFLPLTIKLTERLSLIDFEISIYLSILLGGIFLGLGLGIILAANGSTGGLDIPARIISKYTKITLGKAIALIDIFVISGGVFIFQTYNHSGLEKGFYAVSLLLIMTFIIDLCTKDNGNYNLYFQSIRVKFHKY